MGADTVQAGDGGQSAAEGADRLRLRVGGIDLGDLRQPESEGPDAAEEVGDAAGADGLLAHEGGHGGLCLGRGLQEGARRQADQGLT
jgi:hypothetical protein